MYIDSKEIKLYIPKNRKFGKPNGFSRIIYSIWNAFFEFDRLIGSMGRRVTQKPKMQNSIYPFPVLSRGYVPIRYNNTYT